MKYRNDYDKVFDYYENKEEYEELEPPFKEAIYMTVGNAEQVYLREEPSRDSEPIAIFVKGTKVEVFDEIVNDYDEEWMEIANASGVSGYMMKRFLVSEETEEYNE